ncbi:hypothetical protein DUNSADRAFT_17434 [Dunaliella salina]|uniref:Uncharacterized protein n=1 Tax=Dunaliella salina TaxID=3046 RepID=A0ABQ7H033_DUNSA|nr:hypothetical protein DUNSADRAFT_17434 [Dunaliella salina]|eukprot:KAF5840217.1 hypothetical protein DUNSADRAFT_17434 [Dunaliella salina]
MQTLPRPNIILDSSARIRLSRCCQARPGRRRPRALVVANVKQQRQQSSTNNKDNNQERMNSIKQLWQQAEWDLDFYHYGPKWIRPPILIAAGISFIIVCNIAAKEGLETTAIAAAPVAVAWFLAFYVVPKQFRVFAQKYLRTHPEAWDKALQEALQEQQQNLQRQQEQDKPLQSTLGGQSLQQQEQSKQQ